VFAVAPCRPVIRASVLAVLVAWAWGGGPGAEMADFLPSRSCLAECFPTCALSPREAEQRRKSKQIDAMLTREKQQSRRVVKILLLGAGESGKSTFLKQMRIIHGQDFDQKALEDFRTTIYSNILKGMRVLVDARSKLHIPWEVPENDKVCRELLALMSRPGPEVSSLTPSGHFSTEVLDPSNFQRFLPLLRYLWADSAVMTAYARRREFQLVRNLGYYFGYYFGLVFLFNFINCHET